MCQPAPEAIRGPNALWPDEYGQLGRDQGLAGRETGRGSRNDRQGTEPAKCTPIDRRSEAKNDERDGVTPERVVPGRPRVVPAWERTAELGGSQHRAEPDARSRFAMWQPRRCFAPRVSRDLLRVERLPAFRAAVLRQATHVVLARGAAQLQFACVRHAVSR